MPSVKKRNISCHRWKWTIFALFFLVAIHAFCFILQCAHLFSPEPAKKGVSIADYLPCVRTERKYSESDQRRMLQETQKSCIETTSVKTETPIAAKETSTATNESHTRQSSVRQRKFSFKKGKVRYEGVQYLKVQYQEIEWYCWFFSKSQPHFSMCSVVLHSIFYSKVSSKQTKKHFGSNRNKPKQDMFQFLFRFVLWNQKQKISVCFGLFRFVSVFRTYIETIRTVSKQTETNRNNPKFS